MAGQVVNVRLIDFEEVTPGQIFRVYAGELTDGKPVTGDEDEVEQRTGNIFIDINAGTSWFYNERIEDWKLPGSEDDEVEAGGGE